MRTPFQRQKFVDDFDVPGEARAISGACSASGRNHARRVADYALDASNDSVHQVRVSVVQAGL